MELTTWEILSMVLISIVPAFVIGILVALFACPIITYLQDRF